MNSIILVEPEIPENTGFIARLADNYSAKLKIVNPDFQLNEARKTATNAQDKLREAKIYETVKEATKGLDHIIGTKPGRGMKAKEFEPRENTSVMIGRESSGLSNKELDMCDAVIHIDLPGYSSLNQSHATAIILHELHQSNSKGLNDGQTKTLEKFIGGGKLKELIMRGSPRKDEFDQLIGEIKTLET